MATYPVTTPNKRRLNSKLSALFGQKHSATEHVYIYVNGSRLHYQVAGPLDAPPLVLIHGIGGNVNWWQENIPDFSQHFRTYALDLPGFGYSWRPKHRLSIESQAEFVKSWLDLTDLQKVSLLGHSMGGQIASRVAARWPERVEKLVLAAPSGLWISLKERLRWLLEMPKVSVPLAQTLTIATGTMQTDTAGLLLSLKAIFNDREASQSLSALRAPTLVVWGQADGVLPPALGELTLAAIKQAPARLAFVERGTHNMMFDQARLFNQLVLEFLMR